MTGSIIVNNTPCCFSSNKIRGKIDCGVIRGVKSVESRKFSAKEVKKIFRSWRRKSSASRLLDRRGRGGARGSVARGDQTKMHLRSHV